MSYHITLEWDDDDFYQDNLNTIQRLPTPEVLAEKSDAALQAAMDTLYDLGQRVSDTLHQMPDPPAEMRLELGMHLGAEKGVLTKSNDKAHFVITLVWKSPNDTT